MAHEIQKFEIQLTNPTFTYMPGETITGQVLIILSRTKSAKAFKLNINGICDIDESRIRVASDNIIVKKTYFNNDIILCDNDEKMIELPIGESSYPFTFTLPTSIPSTFEHQMAKITYSIKATMECSSETNYETEVLFKVTAPLEFDRLSMMGIDDFETKNVRKFLSTIDDGYIKFHIKLPRKGFKCGETVTLTVKFSNKSSSESVKRVSLLLIQTIKFINSLPLRNEHKETNVINTVINSGPFPNECESQLSLDIPSLPPSYMKFCNNIDIMYQLQFQADFSTEHSNIQKIYDIVIGPEDSKHTGNQLTSPSAPLLPEANEYSFLLIPEPIKTLSETTINPSVLVSTPITSQPIASAPILSEPIQSVFPSQPIISQSASQPIVVVLPAQSQKKNDDLVETVAATVLAQSAMEATSQIVAHTALSIAQAVNSNSTSHNTHDDCGDCDCGDCDCGDCGSCDCVCS